MVVDSADRVAVLQCAKKAEMGSGG
eukprot:COSAG02_NODE_29054_length_576_cov_5.862222_1_plen_24_part_10